MISHIGAIGDVSDGLRVKMRHVWRQPMLPAGKTERYTDREVHPGGEGKSNILHRSLPRHLYSQKPLDHFPTRSFPETTIMSPVLVFFLLSALSPFFTVLSAPAAGEAILRLNRIRVTNDTKPIYSIDINLDLDLPRGQSEYRCTSAPLGPRSAPQSLLSCVVVASQNPAQDLTVAVQQPQNPDGEVGDWFTQGFNLFFNSGSVISRPARNLFEDDANTMGVAQ